MEKSVDSNNFGSLIKAGIHGDVVIFGFPYDEGAKRSKNRPGAAYGPDCFRRFLPKIGKVFTLA
jgi:hypothetical protein